jgi:4-hydroxy-tetrahydrodipicolinate synthase
MSPGPRLNETARGVYIIAATPFLDDGSVDFAGIGRLVDFYVGHGVTGMTILGMMGEAPKLSAAEQTAVMQAFLRAADRLPVVVGVSNPGLAGLGALARAAMDGGAAGVMVAPLPGLRTEEALGRYVAEMVAELGDIPWVYQDYPQATGVSISVPCFLRLVADHPTLVMLKHEDCPGLGKITRIRQAEDETGSRRVSILCGNGGLYLPQELARGADGAMTGFAYPEMLVEVVRRWGDDPEAAEDLYDAYLPLVRHEQQPGFGLAVRKEVLRRRGVIASARTRAPGPSLTATDQAELTRLLHRLERNLARLGVHLS